MNRRDFLKLSGIAGSGLLVSVIGPKTPLNARQGTGFQQLHACIRLDPTGSIVISVYKQEMGQGILTGLAMIAADEMEANWNQVSIEHATYDKNAPSLDLEHGYFETGGSFSVETQRDPMREAGSTVRELLRLAAAEMWKVDPQMVRLKNGIATNTKSDESVDFGQLAELAVKQKVPKNIQFKDTKDYHIIGQPFPSDKAQRVTKGKLKYSSDEKIPGMVYAMIIRPPVLFGNVVDFDPQSAKAIDGVIDIFHLKPLIRNETFCKGVKGGIVIVANSTWACIKARNLVKVEWNHGPNQFRSSAKLLEEFDQIKDSEFRMKNDAGMIETGFKESEKVISASYTSPYLPSLLMEPLNAIAHYRSEQDIEIWAGSQSPNYTATHIAQGLGLKKTDIIFNPYHMGGGFGRRYFTDFVFEAVLISKHVGKPVKLQWSREDEIQHGAYHPLRKDNYKGGIDEKGNIHALKCDLVSTHEWGGFEVPVVQGHKHIQARTKFYSDRLLQYGSWRSVVPHNDIFPRESFIDELAHAANKDPLQYRIDQLNLPYPQKYRVPSSQSHVSQFETQRRIFRKLYETIHELSDWDRPREKGIGLGVAAHAHHQRSFCAQVAEVDMRDGKLKVTKVYCVADVGLQINPNLVNTQIESSVIWALNPLLKGGIEVLEGRVQQSNFFDTPLLTNMEAPKIIIKSMDLEDREPVGVGEFAVPPLAPAVMNAIFAATGQRHRTLDVSHLT